MKTEMVARFSKESMDSKTRDPVVPVDEEYSEYSLKHVYTTSDTGRETFAM